MAMTGTWKLQLGAAIIAVALMSGLVLRVSAAAFSGTTENTGNSWSTGAIALTDDDGGGAAQAMFDITGMMPGGTSTECIVVTYDGGVDPTAVKLYGTITDGGLAPHLDITVKEGTGGSAANCTGFVAGTTIVNNVTLAAFGTAHTAYGDGAGAWNPAADGETKTYEFTVTLGTDTPGTAQGSDAQAVFTWETTT